MNVILTNSLYFWRTDKTFKYIFLFFLTLIISLSCLTTPPPMNMIPLLEKDNLIQSGKTLFVGDVLIFSETAMKVIDAQRFKMALTSIFEYYPIFKLGPKLKNCDLQINAIIVDYQVSLLPEKINLVVYYSLIDLNTKRKIWENNIQSNFAEPKSPIWFERASMDTGGAIRENFKLLLYQLSSLRLK